MYQSDFFYFPPVFEVENWCIECETLVLISRTFYAVKVRIYGYRYARDLKIPVE